MFKRRFFDICAARALREIKHYQSAPGVIFGHSTMKKIIIELIHDFCRASGFEPMKIGDSACAAIHEAAEEFLVLRFQKGILNMAHADRVTLLKKDLDLVDHQHYLETKTRVT